MTKIWINKLKGDDRIIALGNNKIYKSNPKESKIPEFVKKIEEDESSIDILSIPFSYLRSVQFQMGKNYIQVNFGQESEERLKIQDESKRIEIFRYFKENIPGMDFRSEKYSLLKAIKKPAIAMAVALVFYLWTMHYVVQIANGVQYELVGNGFSFGAIAFSMANLGMTKVNLLFGILMLLAGYSIYKNGKNPPEVIEIYRNTAV